MKLPKSFQTSFLAGIALSLALHPLSALAIDTEFNPNFIISDEEMQDWESMDRADIQAFLDNHGGYISRWQTDDKDGKTRTVADIIHQASKEHEINPKYLLVKLQKEQSLITEDDPTDKQLDGATGYGIADSCAYSCETYLRNKGFGKQVDSAAAIMRWYYENAGKKSWIKTAGKTYVIGDETVVPATDATAFLYTYTPHILGNKNFWKLWQTWFEQVYPNGTLLKAHDESTVYLIEDGKKRPFLSESALATRYDKRRVITVPRTELARYDTGEAIRLPNYSILERGSSYYLLDYDTLRPFESRDVVRKLGYHPDEIIEVSRDDIDHLRKGSTITADTKAPTGRLVRLKEGNELYFYQDNTLIPLIDPAIADVNFAHLSEEVVSISELNYEKMGEAIKFKDGTLIKTKFAPEVYVIADGKKRHIASEKVFVGLGYNTQPITVVGDIALSFHETGEPLYLRSDAAPAVPAEDITPEPLAEEPDRSGVDDDALSIEEKMVRVPQDEWEFIGNAFDTPIDTYLVMDLEDEEIIAGKNIDAVRPIASFAKVGTAYRLMKEGLKLSGVQTYDPTDHNGMYHRFRIATGEKVFNKHLFDAMLVSSLNTPVRMLVDDVEENEAAFIKRLNDQMKDWGLEKTTYTSVTGEPIDTVSTAREYATLYIKSTKNYHVRQYLGKASYEYDEFHDIDGYPHHFDTHSNQLMKDASLPYEIITSKTGYLYESGFNLAMHVKRKSDGKELLIILMGNPHYDQRFTEAKRVANWAASL